ncbi:hypothetical protein Taro_054381 [Colocasia esculenta]|uniref:Uncharacterized protein n=1 Tax=Colocasia esculenta TaxID=4460 RepID=A0A843XQB2_COLES|nr:hypothetical protein [Colocasia esculenta]
MLPQFGIGIPRRLTGHWFRRIPFRGQNSPLGVCVLVHRLLYPPVGRGYLFARGWEPPARPQFRIGTSTRSVKNCIRRFPVRRPNSSLGARSQAADAIAYRHPFAQTGITFRSVIGIAYRTPIQNRHSEALDAPLMPQPTISPIPRFFGSRDSLDYANRWRSPHAKPPSHSDRKSCSTRREISSPGRGYGCQNIADIYRLPRLRESLEDPIRGAAQSQ